MGDSTWKVCSTCKRSIDFEQKYWVCSVSTCNRKRIGLFFCSVPCWDAHVPEARHRDAWAEERKAPTAVEWQRQREAEERQEASDSGGEDAAPRRRIVSGGSADDLPKDVLIVVSKLKAYVRARSDMNTSDSVTGVLSEHLRKLCNEAIRNAAKDGRKTVLDRDFEPLL